MNKLFLLLTATMLSASVQAQNSAITSNKAGDNLYVGVNAGVASPPIKKQDAGFMKALAPTVGVRLGKNLTTVFGLAVDADAYFLSNEKFNPGSKTFIEALDADLLGTFNLTNLFAGYPGEPRQFELIALGGFGWTYHFNHLSKNYQMNSRVAVDLAYNFGKTKQLQLYVEPSLTYRLIGTDDDFSDFQYNIKRSLFAVKVGLNYKFGNSNGSHNFVKAELRDQSEVDALNAKINELRADINSAGTMLQERDRTIKELTEQIRVIQNQPKPTAAVTVVKKEEVNLQPIVIFGQGKSTLDAAGYASCEMVAKYMRNHKDQKVLVRGYASPEGNAEVNKRISEARAQAVKKALVNRYKIAADRILTEGMGATDELSVENDFNRVAMFFAR